MPCSSVMSFASSVAWFLTSSRNANRTVARLASETLPQVLAASLAVFTASSTSCLLAKSTVPLTWPVAGL